MRHSILATIIPLLLACASVRGAETTDSIYVHAKDVKAAVLLRFSSDLFERKALLEPKLGEQQISVMGEYRSAEDFYSHLASLLKTAASPDGEIMRIGEQAIAPQVSPRVMRENNCPYRYPDLQAAIKAMLPDRLRICEPLEFFSLESLRLVGIIGHSGKFRAIVNSPDGVAWSLKEGNCLGQNFGRIFRISSTEIDIREIVQDKAGAWTEKRSILSFK